MDILAVGVLIFFFTIILGLILSRGNVEAVRANWTERRCEPGVMFAGFMYKPPNISTSASQFAIDNFQFCIKSLAQSVINELMMPIMGIFKGTVESAKSAGSSLNGIRTMMTNIAGGFSEALDGFMGVYNRTMMQTVRVSSQLKMAYNRIFGIILSSFYMGLSSLFAGLNMFSFVVKVIMIILGILLAMIVVLIFVLFPVMPLIMSVIAVLISVMSIMTGVIGPEINGMANGFCFAGETCIQMMDGSIKHISEVQLEDVLYENTIVKGILKFSGKNVELFNYKGVKVSGEHLVYDADIGRWMKIIETNSKSADSEEIIYSLVTSTNKIPVLNNAYKQILFADWEEFSDDLLTNKWHYLVQEALHIPMQLRRGPNGSAHLNENINVKMNEKSVSLSTIKIGDIIDDKNDKDMLCKTTVIGIYETNEKSDQLISEGVWHYTNKYWNQGCISGCNNLNNFNGPRKHLITTTGTYIINLGSAELEYLIRDFTEMGVSNLKKVSSTVVAFLNKNNECYKLE
jgi:hypothetical protein